MLAGTLGVLVLALALSRLAQRALLAMLAIAALAAACGVVRLHARRLRRVGRAFGDRDRVAAGRGAAARSPAPWRVAVAALAVVVFQAMLGMWTVTLLLKPIVVMGHLLGGMLTFALLAYVALRIARSRTRRRRDQRALRRAGRRRHSCCSRCQIALGGWTSANYAALACGTDFPQCLGQWWPPTDFHEGFVLWRGIGVNYEGGVLDCAARSAIQIAHRIGALVVFCYLGWLAHAPARARACARSAIALARAAAGAGCARHRQRQARPAAAGRDRAQWRGGAVAVR